MTNLAISSAGDTLYVADAGNYKIRAVDLATLEVTAIAGSGSSGVANGIGAAASFKEPTGVAVRGSTLYVMDSTDHSIREINLNTPPTVPAVSTLAGSGSPGFADDVGTAAVFNSPHSVAITGDGARVYVADTLNHRIREIVTSTGAVSTLAGSGSPGFADDVGTAAVLNFPYGVAVTGDGATVYVADTLNHRIRKIDTSTKQVSTFAGSGSPGFLNGRRGYARFNFPYGVAVTGDGATVYVADTFNHRIRKIVTSTKQVSNFAGSGYWGFLNDSGNSARFLYPKGIVVTPDGTDIYVAEGGGSNTHYYDAATQNNAADATSARIWKIVAADARVTTLSGGTMWSPDGTHNSATSISFSIMTNLAISSTGDTLYVADAGYYKIRAVDLATLEVTTIAGRRGPSSNGPPTATGPHSENANR